MESVTKEHWAKYGRNYFSRYDYENCSADDANKMMAHLKEVQKGLKKGDKLREFTVSGVGCVGGGGGLWG